MLAAQARKAALIAAGALALAYLILAPQTLDLAAQTFRSDLFSEHGFVIWNGDWYGGHSIPGYSLLLPPLGALLGPALLGALCGVAATALFAAVAIHAFGQRAWLGVIWFGVMSMAAPFAGRTAFALGLAIGLACVWAMQRRHVAPAALAGALAACASPVAGLFVLIACAAVLLASLAPRMPALARRTLGGDTGGGVEGAARPALAAGAATALALGLLVLAFPTPGYQPFTFSAWIWVPLVVLALLALAPPAAREPAGFAVIRWGAVVYLLVSVAALLIETPLGGNAVRLGATLAGPLLAILLVRPEPPGRPRLALAVLALPLLWWGWTATIRDVAAAVGDPATERSYYGPLLALLDEQSPRLEPVRVVPTRNRWESVYVAERRPITGGWLRQLESPDFDFLEQPSIGAEEYRSWLAQRGVGLVAVSDGQPDWLAESEDHLFRSGAFDSELVGESGDWKLYRFADPGSFTLAGEARLTALEPDAFEVETGPGEALLALGWSPYFEVVSGDACVERAAGADGRDVTRIVPSAGAGGQTVRVEAHLSLAGALGRDRECAG